MKEGPTMIMTGASIDESGSDHDHGKDKIWDWGRCLRLMRNAVKAEN